MELKLRNPSTSLFHFQNGKIGRIQRFLKKFQKQCNWSLLKMYIVIDALKLTPFCIYWLLSVTTMTSFKCFSTMYIFHLFIQSNNHFHKFYFSSRFLRFFFFFFYKYFFFKDAQALGKEFSASAPQLIQGTNPQSDSPKKAAFMGSLVVNISLKIVSIIEFFVTKRIIQSTLLKMPFFICKGTIK